MVRHEAIYGVFVCSSLDYSPSSFHSGETYNRRCAGNYLPHPRTRTTNGAKFKCKIRVEITNKHETPVRLAAPYFVFNKRSPLKPDPQWSAEYRTARFPLYFFTPKTGQHEWLDVYLRTTETTDTWIGIDPQHPDEHIKKASGAGRIGRLYFLLTEWNDSGRSKTRWVYMKV